MVAIPHGSVPRRTLRGSHREEHSTGSRGAYRATGRLRIVQHVSSQAGFHSSCLGLRSTAGTVGTCLLGGRTCITCMRRQPFLSMQFRIASLNCQPSILHYHYQLMRVQTSSLQLHSLFQYVTYKGTDDGDPRGSACDQQCFADFGVASCEIQSAELACKISEGCSCML